MRSISGLVAFSYIPMAAGNILSSWLRCREHATIPFWAGFGAVAVNTGLNYLLIFGKFGLPCMGIKGAAIATLISQLFNLAFIAVGFALCIRKDEDKPVWSLRFSKITIKDYLIMIMPILVSEFLVEPRTKCRVCRLWASRNGKSGGIHTYLSDTGAYCRST